MRALILIAMLAGAATPLLAAGQQDMSNRSITVSCGEEDPGCEGAAARYRYQQEQARKAAARKAKVDVEVARLGEQRRGEAEKLVRLQEAAAAARKRNVKNVNSFCTSPTAKVSCE